MGWYQFFISCCSILCSLLHRALQEPAPEQKAFSLQEPQAPLPPWQQVSQDTEAVRAGAWGWGESLSQQGCRAAHPESCACTLGAGGAQSRVCTGSELVVSVEMSPMA